MGASNSREEIIIDHSQNYHLVNIGLTASILVIIIISVCCLCLYKSYKKVKTDMRTQAITNVANII